MADTKISDAALTAVQATQMIPAANATDSAARYITPSGLLVFMLASLLQDVLSIPSAPPLDASLANGQIAVYLDQSGNKLTFRVRYSDGSLHTGSVALV